MRVRACLYSRAQMNARVSRSGDADVALSRSLRVWFVCVAFLIAVNLYITLVGGGLQNDPRSGLFSWPSLAIFAIAGVVGIWLSHRTGFPGAWDPQIDNLRRFVYPAAWGLVLGLALGARDLGFHWTATYKTVAGRPARNAPGPCRGPPARSRVRCSFTRAGRFSSRSSIGWCRSRFSCGWSRSRCAVERGSRSFGFSPS